mmetsp:Transcript_19298/g.58286  ORF Transcript_19298/g.58286 Transcript_19298/m.58286 type:complete len:374 (+) Transcript_19298:2905-4026(+)
MASSSGHGRRARKAARELHGHPRHARSRGPGNEAAHGHPRHHGAHPRERHPHVGRHPRRQRGVPCARVPHPSRGVHEVHLTGVLGADHIVIECACVHRLVGGLGLVSLGKLDVAAPRVQGGDGVGRRGHRHRHHLPVLLGLLRHVCDQISNLRPVEQCVRLHDVVKPQNGCRLGCQLCRKCRGSTNGSWRGASIRLNVALGPPHVDLPPAQIHLVKGHGVEGQVFGAHLHEAKPPRRIQPHRNHRRVRMVAEIGGGAGCRQVTAGVRNQVDECRIEQVAEQLLGDDADGEVAHVNLPLLLVVVQPTRHRHRLLLHELLLRQELLLQLLLLQGGQLSLLHGRHRILWWCIEAAPPRRWRPGPARALLTAAAAAL